MRLPVTPSMPFLVLLIIRHPSAFSSSSTLTVPHLPITSARPSSYFYFLTPSPLTAHHPLQFLLSLSFLFSSLTTPRHLHPTLPLTARIFATHLSLRSSPLVILPFPYLSFTTLSLSIPTPHSSSISTPFPSPPHRPLQRPSPPIPSLSPSPRFFTYCSSVGAAVYRSRC